MTKKTFAIIGGGIGGLATAIALQRIGCNVQVYEGRPAVEGGAGIVLAPNALMALASIGLSVEGEGNALNEFSIINLKGQKLTTTDTSKFASSYPTSKPYSFHRADLYRFLMDKLAPGTIQFQKRCKEFEATKTDVTIRFDDATEITASYVIAADGLNSLFRQRLVPESVFRYSGYTCWRAIVDAEVSTSKAVEIWGSGKRFGIVPLAHNRVYWYATVNSKPSDPRYEGLRVDQLKEVFSEFGPQATELIGKVRAGSFLHHDIFDSKPLSKYYFDNVLLLGDAAHATTPNMGQGACMAIEDAAVLAALIKKLNIDEAFKEFEKRRLPRVRKIVTTSYSLGRMSQLSNPILRSARDLLMRSIPASIAEKQMRFLYEISFQ